MYSYIGWYKGIVPYFLSFIIKLEEKTRLEVRAIFCLFVCLLFVLVFFCFCFFGRLVLFSFPQYHVLNAGTRLSIATREILSLCYP